MYFYHSNFCAKTKSLMISSIYIYIYMHAVLVSLMVRSCQDDEHLQWVVRLEATSYVKLNSFSAGYS